jgi:hypothetical protein
VLHRLPVEFLPLDRAVTVPVGPEEKRPQLLAPQELRPGRVSVATTAQPSASVARQHLRRPLHLIGVGGLHDQADRGTSGRLWLCTQAVHVHLDLLEGQDPIAVGIGEVEVPEAGVEEFVQSELAVGLPVGRLEVFRSQAFDVHEH